MRQLIAPLVSVPLVSASVILGFSPSSSAFRAPEPFTHVDYQKLSASLPTSESPNAKVWRIRQTPQIRINLVEMTGELSLHQHPDAEHSLMVLEGRVRAQIGTEHRTLSKGDFISIPAGVPHKYWSLTRKARLVSMDAPYYDPEKTIALE